MRTSLIVVNHNGGREVVENLRSLLKEIGDLEHELLVVDNCSADGSVELIARSVPSARVIREPTNRGYAAAANRGFEQASGDVLVVMNADIRPSTGALATLLSAVELRDDFALLGVPVRDQRGRPEKVSARALPRVADITREALFIPPRRPGMKKIEEARGSDVVEVPAITGAVMGLRRESLLALGPMDDEYFLYNEDVEWCRRCAEKGLRVGVVGGADFLHSRGAATRQCEARAFAARVLSDFRYFCDGEAVPPERIRRLWLRRLALRSWLYRMDERFGVLGRRAESGRRAAVYRLLGSALRGFEWSSARDGQDCHPSRLLDAPCPDPPTVGARRPAILHIVPDMRPGRLMQAVEELVTGPLRESYRFEILCLTTLGKIGEKLEAEGHRVHVARVPDLSRRSGMSEGADFARLLDPDLVHCHGQAADAVASLAFANRVARVSSRYQGGGAPSSRTRLRERAVLKGACTVLAENDTVAEQNVHLLRDAMLPLVPGNPPSASDSTRPAAMARVYAEALGRVDPDGRKRVLHLITRLIVGGAQQNTIASVARVDPERYESHLWIGPQTGAEGSLNAHARREGILLRVLPNLVREVNPWKDLLVTIELTRLLRSRRFDIVHTHSSKAGIVGRVAAKLARVPHVVHTVHGWGFHDRMNPVVKRFYVLLERVMEPWTRPLVTVSNRTTVIGLDERIGTPGSYRMIRSGIPLEEFHPDQSRASAVRAELGIPADRIVIGSIGRFSPQKNPLDFVRVASSLAQSHQNLTFLYVGDGPMRGQVERAVADAGLTEATMLLGIRDDVSDLLRVMDIFILTSLWEGLPRVVPQALASGVPVVVYDVAGIGESVIDGVNGHLVQPGDTEKMLEKLAGLIEDRSARLEMSRRAADEFDRSFSEGSMISGLESLYDELTGSSS